MAQLPETIARDINPEAVAARINESLRQQFIRSTIPETAEALATVGADMKTVTVEFATTARKLGDSYKGAAEDARLAIESLAVTAGAVRREVEGLSRKHWWSIYMLVCVALLIGFVFGILLTVSIDMPAAAG